MGSPVGPTHFVPTKTPLSCRILSSWSLPEKPKHELTVPGLLETQRKEGRHVGMILDLSNHESLYAEDLCDCGLRYERVQASSWR